MHCIIPVDFQIDANVKLIFISTVPFKCYSNFRFPDSYLKNITGSIFEVFFLIVCGQVCGPPSTSLAYVETCG